MEVTGRVKEKKPCTTKHVNTLLFCVPCELDSKFAQAFGYCQDCREHLCETCFRLHRRPTPLRHHVMLDSATMPKEQANRSVTEDYELCDIHRKEQIKFYCEEHDEILCGICITVDHRRCKLNFIPGICNYVDLNSKRQEILEELLVVKTELKHELQVARNERNESLECRVKIIQDIQCFRKDINECINRLELATTQEAKRQIDLKMQNIQSFVESIDHLMNDLDIAESELKLLRQQKEMERLFIKLKKTKVLLEELEAKLKTSDQNKSTEIIFECNHTILKMIKPEQFGLLTSTTKRISISNCEEILNLNSCSLSSFNGIAVMSPNEIVVIHEQASSGKFAIICFSVKERRVMAQLDIDVEMYFKDITCLPENKIALTFPDDYLGIRIFSVTSTGITEIQSLRPTFQCFGIAYCEDKLIVTSYLSTRDEARDGQVLTLSMNGDVLCCFGGTNLIDLPTFIEISEDKKHIYLSDTYKVIKLDRKGNVINAYKRKDKNSPEQIKELEDGSILVLFSDYTNSKIVRLSHDLQMCEELELNMSDIQTFSYCKETKQLFVVCSSSNAMSETTILKRFDVQLH